MGNEFISDLQKEIKFKTYKNFFYNLIPQLDKIIYLDIIQYVMENNNNR